MKSEKVRIVGVGYAGSLWCTKSRGGITELHTQERPLECLQFRMDLVISCFHAWKQRDLIRVLKGYAALPHKITHSKNAMFSFCGNKMHKGIANYIKWETKLGQGESFIG